MVKLSRLFNLITARCRRWDDVSSDAVRNKKILADLGQVLLLSTPGKQRQYIEKFEHEFADYHGVKYALGVNSGTSAIYFALSGLGIGAGDEVITVANTWLSTITAIRETGAKCKFCEIDSNTGSMEPLRLEEVITPKTRALVVVHMYGIPVNMPAILSIAKRHGIIVIEDACQAIGTKIADKHIGSWGDVGCFSFHTNKLVGAPVDGGMIVTDSELLISRIKKMVQVNWDTVFENTWSRVPSRLSALSIPILREKLRCLESTVTKLNHQFQHYQVGLSGLSETGLLTPTENVTAAHRNCVLVSKYSPQLRKGLQSSGWRAGPMYDGSLAFIQQLSAKGVSLPITEYFLQNHVLLPMGKMISSTQQDDIIASLRHYHARSGESISNNIENTVQGKILK